jgi:hypothetical protein
MREAATLTGVQPRACAKPRCEWLGASLHRHHRKHEALWLAPWARRQSEVQWRAFVRRYKEFRPEDVVLICEHHHAEIHSIYDQIIADDCAKTGLPLYLYSWKQGRVLMRRLEEACKEWLQHPTSGIDSKIYGATRRLRWALLKKEAKKRHQGVKRPPRKLRRRRGAKRKAG